jgi:hypothetical protein
MAVTDIQRFLGLIPEDEIIGLTILHASRR